MSKTRKNRKSKTIFVTKAGLKKTRGWTSSMIWEFLGEPDTTRTNKRNKSGPRIQFYDLERVLKIETSPKFKIASEAAKKRPDATNAAAESQRQTLVQRVDKLKIEVPIIDDKTLTLQACDHYNRLPRSQRNDSCAGPSSPSAFLARIKVNFLRHGRTRYEAILKRWFRRTGADDARLMFKKKVLDVIATKYPKLGNECEEQKRKAETVLLW